MTDLGSTKRVFCYCHIEGQIILNENCIDYVGGRTIDVLLTESTSYEDLVEEVGEKLGKSVAGNVFRYTLDFDRKKLIDLENDAGLKDLLNLSDRCCNMYIFRNERVESLHNGLGDYSFYPFEEDQRAAVENEVNTSNNCVANPSLGSSSLVECTSSKKDKFMSGIWKNEIIDNGQQFEDAKALRVSLYRYSVANGFSYKFRMNNKTYISVYCKAEGCDWHLTAYKMRDTALMVIGTFIDVHNHCAQDAIECRPMPKSKYVATIVVEKLKLQPETSAHQIRATFESECGMGMTYHQEWLCKEQTMKLLYGKPEDSYKLLPWLCEQIKEADPQSVVEWTFDLGNRFRQVFVAYGCSIIGFFAGCRGLIFIDGCHLSGPYKGTLLSASTVDADNQLYPLAFAIVSSECLDDWMWFLHNLKRNVTRHVEVTIISDRHQNIITSVREIYGSDRHAYCYRHVKENFSSEVNKLLSRGKKVKEKALQLLDAVAYARLEEDFNVALNNLTLYKKELGEWVLDNNPEQWVMSKFKHPCWDHMTSNIAESFNSWILKERRYCIISLINEHREKLAQKIYNCKSDVNAWKNGVGPNIEEKLVENIERGKFFHVSCYSDFTAKVSNGSIDMAVNLATRECTCLRWKMSEIPCPHSCVVIEAKHCNIYEFVDECYKCSRQNLIYSVTMVPVETHNIPDITALNDPSTEIPLMPPVTKRPPGRSRVKRIESQFIKQRKIQCSKCKVVGHNRATCRSSNPA